MTIKPNFDTAGNIEQPVLVLTKRNGDVIGNINNIQNFVFFNSMEEPREISFDAEYEESEVWSELKDWRVIWIPEWNDCYKIQINLKESSKKLKVITATHLAEYELSHRNLHEVYINDFTEYDSDPTPTIFFDESNPEYSMLHRLLKGTTYVIEHVDESLKKIQRTFNFSDNIHAAFQEIAEEINCYFEFDVKRNSEGKFVRTVKAYDLYSYCPECGHRDEFENVCPKCGNTEYIVPGYGEDTDIFLSVDNFVDENAYSTNCEEIKTCFRLEAGDDEMTAAVINQNPNGTNLLWSIPEEFVSDMSDELRSSISLYNELYDYYQEEYIPSVDMAKFNSLVNKYKGYNEDLYEINDIKGFQQLTEVYYQAINMEGYLEHVLMLTIQTSETSAEQQGKLLTSQSLSPVSVKELKSISVTSASNAVVGMAKVIIDGRYQVTEADGAVLSNDKKTWTGKLIVTTYSNEDDKYTTDTLTVTIDENYEEFVKQKIEKSLKKDDTENYSISSLFEKDDVSFKNMLKQYALVPLRDSILESCNSCINILIDNNIGSPSDWEDKDNDLYESLYIPYLNKLTYIQEEIKIRDAELETVRNFKESIGKIRSDVQSILNFKDFLGSELYDEFSIFQIDDTYSNSNFISTGLSESEIFEYAKEFYEVAKKEIKKASTIKHIISSTVKNIFAMKEFDKLRDKFSTGNWIRIEVNDIVYKLRLLSYEIDFQDYEHSSITFSDGTVVHNDASVVSSTLKAVKSIQASYGSTKNKAEDASGAKKVVDGWSQKGMSTATVKLMNDADNQSVVYDQHGIILRRKDDFTGDYEGTQAKLINSTFAFTTDGWKTVRTAIGRFFYTDPTTGEMKEAYGINGELLCGKLLMGEELGIYNSSGTLKFDKNGLTITDGTNVFSVNPNGDKLLNISNGSTDVLYLNDTGNLYISGQINATSGYIGGSTGFEIGSTYIRNGEITNVYNTSMSGVYVGIDGFNISGGTAETTTYLTKNSVSIGGKLTWDGISLDITGKVTATEGKIGDFNIFNGSLQTDVSSNGQYISLNRHFLFFRSVDEYYSQRLTDLTIDGRCIRFEYADKKIGDESIFITPDNMGLSISKSDYDYILSTMRVEENNGIKYGLISVDNQNEPSGGGVTLNGLTGEIYARGVIETIEEVISGGKNAFRSTYGGYGWIMRNNGENFYFLTTNVGDPYGNFNTMRPFIIRPSDGRVTINNMIFAGDTTDSIVALRPVTDNTYRCGSSDHRFLTVHAANGTIQTSDEREKDILGTISNDYKQLFMSLEPIKYRWKYGNDKKVRLGLGAQTTEKKMLELGITDSDIIQHDYFDEPSSNGMTDRYGMDYIAVAMMAVPVLQETVMKVDEHDYDIQQLKDKIDNLQSENIELKQIIHQLRASV